MNPSAEDDDDARPITDEAHGEEGPDTADLSEDPAYEPDDEGLKDIKGG
jgi:hypothetical protein